MLVKSGDLEQVDLDLLKAYKKKPTDEIKKQIIQRDLILVRKTKGGDIKARNALFLKHTPFVRSFLHNKFILQPEEFDDYISQCFMCFLVYCIPFFDETKGSNFLNYFYYSLDAWFKNDANYQKRHKLDLVYLDKFDENEEESGGKDKFLKSEDRNFGWIENS